MTHNENSKGFTLIELLAVIIILGVLMIIAIPSVTEYISSSRKNAYITSVQRYMDAASNKVNSLEYNVTDTEVTYYIPTVCIPLEKGGNSPFGEFEESYVVVTYDGFGYDYYYTGRDSANHGIVLTYRDLLEPSYIETGVKDIDLTIGVGNRDTIILYDGSCDSNNFEKKDATAIIQENDTLKNGSTKLDVSTNNSCFEFDESSGTILRYKCGGPYDLLSYRLLNEVGCINYFMDEWSYTETESQNYCVSENGLKYDIQNDYISSSRILELRSNNIISLNLNTTDNLNVVIPAKINGTIVSKIGDYAFNGTNVHTIVLSKTITKIGEDAFGGNDMLYNIVNKTNRTFNWDVILGTRGNNSNEFITDLYIDERDGGGCSIATQRAIKITTELFKLDLVNMFNVLEDDVTLVKNDGYKVYYNIGQRIQPWEEFNVNETVSGGGCDPVRVKIENNSGEIVFIGQVTEIRCAC